MNKVAVLALAGMLLFSMPLLTMPVWSDVIVPFEWIVPGAYATYLGGEYGPHLFYPNHTSIMFIGGVDEFSLKWTVLEREGDSVLLNLTFFVEGNGGVYYTESVPDGKVDILDIATVAKAFGKQTYQWGYDYNADVIEDQKVDILDIATVAKAYGTTPDDSKWNSKADIAPEEDRQTGRHVIHRKNLLLDIDIYTRDTFLNGKPLGKTCFWADPYADIGDKVVLYGLPPEELVGTVEIIDDEYTASWGWPDITAYGVKVFQVDPAAWFANYFDWNTGMVMKINLQGASPKNPDSHHGYCVNDTEYIITRYATTPIGTELNLVSWEQCTLWLNSTNVQLGPPE